MTIQGVTDEHNAEILVGLLTREEVLGEDDDIEFVQPYIPDRAEKLRRIAAEERLMPYTFYDLPPDHPIFSGGPHFVFRNEQPLDLTPAEDDGVPPDQESEDE